MEPNETGHASLSPKASRPYAGPPLQLVVLPLGEQHEVVAVGGSEVHDPAPRLLLGRCPPVPSTGVPYRTMIIGGAVYYRPVSDLQPNPYTPGAGDRPRVIVGRAEQLALAEAVRSQLEARYSANCLIFTGLRGVGKTVLLKEIATQSAARGWFAPYVQIRRGVGTDRAFGEAARRITNDAPLGTRTKKALGRLQRRGGGVQILGSGGTIGPEAGKDGFAIFSDILKELGSAAADDGVGLALIVDELQALGKQPLGDLIQVVLDLRDRVPLAFIGGGLPYLPSYIAKVTTSTERFRYEGTDFLVTSDALRAVADPALAENVEWDEDALREVVHLADGYPYFLQLFASETWTAATATGIVRRITLDHVAQGRPVAQRQIERGMYESRFEQLTSNQVQYVRAMVNLLDTGSGNGQRVRSGEVARELGKGIGQASPTRDSLIRAGTIHSPTHGELEFSVPGFDDYLRRRQDD